MDVLKKSVILFGILKVIAGKQCSKKSKYDFIFGDAENDNLNKIWTKIQSIKGKIDIAC